MTGFSPLPQLPVVLTRLGNVDRAIHHLLPRLEWLSRLHDSTDRISFLSGAALVLRVADLTGGFKCFRREVLEAIDLDAVQAKGYAFQVELTYRAVQRGFRVVEVPIVFRDRRVGSSKMSRAIVAEAIWRVPLLRLRK